MVYSPKHQRQLDGSATAGEDCWVRSVSMAVDFATKGAKVPTVNGIRDRAGVPSGSGNTADQERAAESYDTPGETGGREPVKYERKVAAPWGDQPVDAMKNGEKVVILSIDYGVINEVAPGKSGDPNFNGDHSVMYGATRQTDNGLEVKSYDSLYDGRRSGIPNGPQWIPLWVVKEAAFGFAGQGKWTGGIVPTAWLLEPDDPEQPEPAPEPVDEMEAALIEERAALVAFVADAERRIAHLDTIIPTNVAAATTVVSSGASSETDESVAGAPV